MTRVTIYRLECDGVGPFHFEPKSPTLVSKYHDLKLELINVAQSTLKEPHQDGIMVISRNGKFAATDPKHLRAWLTPTLISKLASFGFKIISYKVDPADLINSWSGMQVMFHEQDVKRHQSWQGAQMAKLLGFS